MEQVYAFYMVCGSAFGSMVDRVVFRRHFIRLAVAGDLKLAKKFPTKSPHLWAFRGKGLGVFLTFQPVTLKKRQKQDIFTVRR